MLGLIVHDRQASEYTWWTETGCLLYWSWHLNTDHSICSHSIPILFGRPPEAPFFTYCWKTLSTKSINKNYAWKTFTSNFALFMVSTTCKTTEKNSYLAVVRFEGIFKTSPVNTHHWLRNLGPLWTHSCFPFESMNGTLKEHFHGTKKYKLTER